MNSNAKNVFAVLAASLFGLVGYWIGQGWAGSDSPSFMEFVGLLWPIIMGIIFLASFLTMAILATGGKLEN